MIVPLPPLSMRTFMLSPEQLQELQDEEEETDGLNGETAVWVPGRNERSEDPNGGSCLEGLD